MSSAIELNPRSVWTRLLVLFSGVVIASNASAANAPVNLAVGLSTIRWTDTKQSLRKRDRRATPQSEEGLVNVDLLSIPALYLAGPRVRIDATVFFAGSGVHDKVKKISLGFVPVDYVAKPGDLEAAYAFLARTLALPPMPEVTQEVRTKPVRIRVLRDPGDFAIEIESPLEDP